MNILKTQGYFEALIKSPPEVREVSLDYLGMAQVPNLAGYCGKLGISVRKLVNFSQKMEKEVEDPYITESMEIIAQCITAIEDSINTSAMTGDYSAHFAKFNLSAYHNRNEKTQIEQTSNKTISITIEGHNPTTLEELREFNRLEEAMKRQTEAERAQIGLSDDDGGEVDAIDLFPQEIALEEDLMI
jgi:hypothetical protein